MIDFSGVKAISIPEGNVKKITSGSTVLWEAITKTTVAYSGAHSKLSGTYSIGGVAHDIYQLTGSGTLTLTGGGARVWLCGGGSEGGAGTNFGVAMKGSGNGGGGGHVNSATPSSGEYAVTIGAAEGNTQIVSSAGGSVFSVIANGATTTDGGSGGGPGFYYMSSRWTESNPGSGDGVSTYPFGIEALYAHCAGGGGGSRASVTSGTGSGGSGGSNGSDGGACNTNTAGGAKGGGNGAKSGASGSNASFYGSGGGGAGVPSSSTSPTNGGSGYQGVVYVAVPA